MEWHCPICRKPTNSETDKDFPFCNERCKLTDLGNWASEKYKISEPAHDESESASESAIGETTESAAHSLSDSQEPRSSHGQTNGRRN